MRKKKERTNIKDFILTFVMLVISILTMTACGNSTTSTQISSNTSISAAESETSVSDSEKTAQSTAKGSENDKHIAKDAAEMQTDDPSIATRIPLENGTKINIRFGDTVITGILNDSTTAQALIEKLPYTVHMSRYSHDFCGVTEALPYEEADVHYGWLNGDIDYALNAPYFTILFKDEDHSEQYGDQVNIGVITSPIADIDALSGSYDVTVALAE